MDLYERNRDLFDRVKKGDLDYIKTVTPDVLLNARNGYGRSVISAALEENQFECCKEILKKCPSLLYFQNNRDEYTLLHYAIKYDRYTFIDYFLSVGLVAATNAEGSFMKWIKQKMLRFKKWIKMKNNLGDTALTMAASSQFLHTVKRLIEVDREYKLGLSGIVGRDRRTALQWAVKNKDHEMIKLLTDEGDPYSDYIPYPIAMDLFDHVKNGDLDYVKTVGSDVLLKSRDDKNRNSALGIATQYDQLGCSEEILKRCPILLYHQNNFKETVLHNSITNYKLVDFFVGVGLDTATIEGSAEIKVENMQCFKNWINLLNSNEHTVLTLAVKDLNHDIVRRLVQLDRQYKLGLPEITGWDKKTPLERALKYRDQEMIKLLSEGTDLDLKHGANTNNSNSADIKFKSGEHKMFTLGEVSKHNISKDCWLVINDKVYDVTKFLETHPGGDKVLLEATGKDATNVFKEVHSHSSNAMTMMDKFYVGVYDSITSLLTKLDSDKPQPYSHEQLVGFTEDFSQRLGSGGFGDVYKGKLPNGVLIAVKVLKNIDGKEKIMEEQFAAEVDTMGRTYHRNLIRLYGYCYDAITKFKALIYDYMESGSFDTVLFEKKVDLPWEKLHNIAKEIAHGISYLHESCYPQIIHLDIKPANILLDSNLSPKVIDFGLAKVNMGESSFDQTKIKGTRNYMAPEVNQPNQIKLSCKCDVYSFGMMMFDILGSKRNHVDKRFWFPCQVWEKFSTNQLDKFILDCGIKEDDKDNAKRLSIVAFLCVEYNALARPMMSTVVKMLEGKIKLDTPVTPFYPNICSESDSSSMSDSRDA